MATTEHATNEQCALIMGWTKKPDTGSLLYDENGDFTGFSTNPALDDWFNPEDDLNHAALVEARLAELGLMKEYCNLLDHQAIQSNGDFLEFLIRANAQTRCVAAWATWQAWKERKKEQSQSVERMRWVQPGEEFYPTE